jgi:hypothetical protein
MAEVAHPLAILHYMRKTFSSTNIYMKLVLCITLQVSLLSCHTAPSESNHERYKFFLEIWDMVSVSVVGRVHAEMG